MTLLLTFYWICSLGTSFIFLYNILNLPYDTVSKLNACIYQIFITNWSVYNIYNKKNNYLIDYSMLGYYIYDTITCIIAPYDSDQYLYIIHHGVAIYMISMSNLYKYSPYNYRNLLYLLMELSAGMFNSMKLINIYYPNESYNYQVITYSIFGLTRGIIFPICIINYIKELYKPLWYYKVDMLLLSIIYTSSIWCVIKWII